jgi:hypothetical protein
VLRVGTGTGALGNTTAAVFLDTFYPLPGSTKTGTVVVPTANSGLTHALTILGSALSEGALTRSADGHYLAFAGYDVAPGGSNLNSNRVVGRVDASGGVDTTTRLPIGSFGTNVRGAATADGSAFWVSGNGTGFGGGTIYAALGAAGVGTQVLANPANMRMVGIAGGQLYGDSGVGGFTEVFSIGTGLPTTAGQTATGLPGMTSLTSPYGFAFIGASTIFVADSNSGLSRWTLSGGTWTQDMTFTVLTAGCLSVTGWTTSTGVSLIVTTIAGTVERVDVPSASSPSATLLETQPTNTEYRGVALAPH